MEYGLFRGSHCRAQGLEIVLYGIAVCVAIFSSTAAGDIITVDNADPGFTVLSGSWDTGSYPTPNGSDYRWAITSGYDPSEPFAEVEWRPTLPVTGAYELYVWYVQGTNRADNAEFVVHHAGGSTSVHVNQQSGGSQWNSLGTFQMNAGNGGYVTLHNDAHSAVVIADAVRFETAAVTSVYLTMADTPSAWGSTTPVEGGTYEYSFGQAVAIEAAALPGYEFDRWEVSAGVAVANPLLASTTVTMDVDKTVTAVFIEDQPPTPQFRGFWADAFHAGFKSTGEIDAMIDWALAGNYNAIVPEILAYQDTGDGGHGAYWNSTIVPKASDISGGIDPLAYLVQQAHASGLEVHPWLVTFRVSTEWPPAGNSLLAAHPEWLMTELADMGYCDPPRPVFDKFTFDPGSPDVQEYLMSIVRELCTNYEIDGIHWDYIRYTQKDAGYPTDTSYENSSLRRFQRITGRSDVPSSSDSQWDDFRRRTVGEVVRRAMIEVQSISNPRQPLKHTAALVTWYPANSDFHQTRPYYDSLSDWEYWQSMGWLDVTIPMAYFDDNSYPNTYRAWVDNCINWAQSYNRHTYIGPGIYLNTFADSVDQLEYALTAGANGVNTYSYQATNDAGQTWSDWYAYVQTNLFTEPTTIPEMPWRDPMQATEAMVYGIVTDFDTGEPVDDATVAIAGVQDIKTDGNGFYVLTRVPAAFGGSLHDVTASYSGYTSRTLSATVTPAGITQLDIPLGGCYADGDCDDGLFCNGAEVCGALGECTAGAAVDCDDEIACTLDSCDEENDECAHVADNSYCDDGQFCNGEELCHEWIGCLPGVDPCSVESWCDDVGDSCVAYGDGDFDDDGDVDLGDFAMFQECFGENAVGVCIAGDLAGEGGVVDGEDFAEFAASLTGP